MSQSKKLSECAYCEKEMSEDPIKELNRLCHSMSYGDDSKETWKRYCELMGIKGSEEELENQREEKYE